MTTDEELAFSRLLEAARRWRSGLIPRTSSGTWDVTRRLLEAVAEFDRPPCTHPREWRIYRPTASEQLAPPTEGCGYCGVELPPL